MNKGRMIFLQGPSSSGKSTLADALQRTLDECWWRLEADDVSRMWPGCQPPNWWQPTEAERPHPSWQTDTRLNQWYEIYWGCLSTIAHSGANVIAVGGWLDTDRLVQAAHAFAGIDAVVVGVHCSLEELERREAARGNRPSGYAREQIDCVFAHAPFDITVDTSLMSIDEAADYIRAELNRPRTLAFLDQIRRAYPNPKPGNSRSEENT